MSRSKPAPAGLATALALAACAPAPSPPDLLLVTVDTLRADRLACYGGAEGVGRALCDLADPGVRYGWAISPAPSTAPAIASILTSRYPSDHGVSQFGTSFLSGEATTLAEVLREAGYATAAFVSNPVLARSRNLGQGFDVYDDRMTRREPRRPRLVERDAASATDAALAWVRTARRPWFLWIHYQDPHGPYQPPDATPPRDRAGAPRLPVLSDHSGRGGIPSYQVLEGAFSPEAYERAYADEIAYLGQHVSRLVETVDALGPPPVIAFTADHGEAFGEDDYWLAHGHSVGLEQIRVPLLWRLPGAEPERAVATPVSTIDVAPTLLRVAGLPVPASFLGRALPDVARATSGAPTGRATAGARALYSEHRYRIAVVAGDVYYARDRAALTGPTADRITGGTLEPLPARTAALRGGGALPDYRPLGATADGDEIRATFEPLLERFAAGANGASAPRGELPQEARERLEALGYLE